MFEINHNGSMGAKIRVVGVGGAGCNAVNTMIRSGLEGIDFITANTDQQALEASLAPTKIAIGQLLTKGLGAGANPDVGRGAAIEDEENIRKVLEGADMVFITAGMGGGTGTGAAPVFARISRELGALTVGVITKPFTFEGKKRMRNAQLGLEDLKANVDSLISIPNQRLLSISGTSLSMIDAFKKADEVLLNAVQGIADLINHTGLINSDFADVKTIMQNKGLALMGIGYGEGDHRAIEAATNAITSPLLEDVSIQGATGLIINITGGSSLKIHEVNEATTLITEAAHDDAEIIFGTVIDESIKDRVKVTVIATGLGGVFAVAKPPVVVAATSTVVVNEASVAVAPLEVQAPVSSEPEIAPVLQQDSIEELLAGISREQEQEIAAAEMAVSQIFQETEREGVSPGAGMTTGMDDFFNDHHAVPAEQTGAVSGAAQSELARARAIAQRLGITNLTDDEYDIPTYLRRHQEREI